MFCYLAFFSYFCKMKRTIFLVLTIVSMAVVSQFFTACNTKPKDFVYIDDGTFMLNDSVWFPLMLNYKTEVRNNTLYPVSYYGEAATFSETFGQISGWGFNSVRVCMDVMNDDVDTKVLFPSVQKMLDTAQMCGLKVMLLIKPPFSEQRNEFTQALLQTFANNSTLWAYDFMNEPLYFDPAETRDKVESYNLVVSWHEMMEEYAPHQLFTIAFAEPIEVFEWDPALLPVDFVEMHTYHPLRVPSEMYWYGHFVGKPWIVGETSLPVDNDSVPYLWQSIFMKESFQCAIDNGAIGFGWWEYHDCLNGTNFEAWYTGLVNASGEEKPATSVVRQLLSQKRKTPQQPVNYFNMLGYQNLAVAGCVLDEKGKPIEGAVVRGWNEDWSVGMNTFTDEKGRFALISNDVCTHFEISATTYSKEKFDKSVTYENVSNLPDKNLEYQQISYVPFLLTDTSMLTLNPEKFKVSPQKFDIGTIVLKRIDY